MYKVQHLRALVNARLNAAADEIFELFERTIAEYEEELLRSKDRENQSKQERLDSLLLNPRVVLFRADQETIECPGANQTNQEELIETSGVKPEPEEQDIITYEPESGQSDPESNFLAEIGACNTDHVEDWGASASGSGANLVKDTKRKKKNKTEKAKQATEKTYKCPFCMKTTQNRHNLKNHIRVHTGDKPYTCTVCGKGFRVTSTLKLHMRTHTGERPFKCTLCHKSYIQKTHLDTHIRTHTGARPFSCPICAKAFIQSSHLKGHMLTHHKALNEQMNEEQRRNDSSIFSGQI